MDTYLGVIRLPAVRMLAGGEAKYAHLSAEDGYRAFPRPTFVAGRALPIAQGLAAKRICGWCLAWTKIWVRSYSEVPDSCSEGGVRWTVRIGKDLASRASEALVGRLRETWGVVDEAD